MDDTSFDMRIATAECFRYAVPFTAPVPIGSRSVESRRGAVLCLRDDHGNEGWGEAAPLPGFSRETMPEMMEGLQRQARDLTGTQVRSNGLDGMFETLSSPLLPSVEFALESALADLVASVRDETVPRLLGGGRDVIRLNALVTDLAANVDRTSHQIQEAGYSAVKLKVGRHDLQWEASRVRAFSRALGEDVALRLDANRAWTVDEATSFAEMLGPLALDYIEEPLKSPAELPRFVDRTGHPVALDETTREIAPESLSAMEGVRAVVLKPMLLGGLRTVRRWSMGARESGIRPVFSASYEAGVGMRMLVILTSVFSDAPAGFGTYGRMETDVVTPRLPLEGPTVFVEQVLKSTPDRSRLEEGQTYTSTPPSEEE